MGHLSYHRMKWCELREYKWNEYVAIAVNRNLSNCEIARKQVFRGFSYVTNFPNSFCGGLQESRNEVCGIKGVGSGFRRVGSGITAGQDQGLQAMGSGSAVFLRDQMSGCTIFVGSGTFGIKDRKLVYKNMDQQWKAYLVTTMTCHILLYILLLLWKATSTCGKPGREVPPTVRNSSLFWYLPVLGFSQVRVAFQSNTCIQRRMWHYSHRQSATQSSSDVSVSCCLSLVINSYGAPHGARNNKKSFYSHRGIFLFKGCSCNWHWNRRMPS